MQRARIDGCWMGFIVLAVLFSTMGLAWANPVVSLKPRPLDSEAYGETYTTIGDFKDGTYVLLQLLLSNAGIGDQKAACRATVVPRNGKTLNDTGRVGRDGWRYVAKENRLDVKHCQIRAVSGKTTFQVTVDSVSVEMTMSRSAKVTQPPGHELRTDDGFYRAQVLVPWSDATLRVTPKGGKSVESQGKAYLDRTLSNVLLPDIADAWYRFRGFFGTQPVLIEIRFPPEKAKPVGWIWQGDGGRPTPLDSAIKLTKSKGGIQLNFSQAGQTFTLRSTQRVYEYEPVKEHGIMGRLAKPWIGDPKISTFRAKMTGGKNGPVVGILEQADINP